ncbi:class I SAM-dependent methyltransferase [Kineosporia sp. NBRC 101731]|uniref:class I SAM-dependent methyltransferase n=1 Tax=Kineosporia sp. NBRC 101731 TaxID=3032199 RepID=UPI0024A5A436|nr:class I SAM-dependent methyltransferase [Kineosporia sp. NBRC 101731]GLY29791.1 methyltransferase type 12 [Kineosporia sp. NBRC 101731]
MEDPVDITLATYEAAAETYVDMSGLPGSTVLGFLDRLAALIGGGTVLEIGSGPGWDADHLETRGLRVVRTDATRAFVERLRARGHDAQILDARTDPLGGPYQAILADAVLLHLPRNGFEDFLRRAGQAVVPDGLLGFTLKEGDGDGWSTEKVDLPRHFTYWREAAVREALEGARWSVLAVDHVVGRSENWLHVIARSHPDEA